ncbi:phytanoyl-CoA dioxygenase family protein [Achromobacter insuavis]
MEETSLLSEAETARYRDQGYLALPDMCPQDEVGYIRRTLLELFANKTGYNEGAQYDFISRDDPSKPAKFPSLHDPRHYAPGLLKTAYHERTLELARQLLGEDAALYGEHALLKPALVGAETPWHQDEAFRSPDFVYNELSIWLALQPATLENGCMQFIPNQQERGAGASLARRRQDAAPARVLRRLPARPGGGRTAAPGGCTVHDARTLHFTGANTSPQPRLAYILIYNTPPVYKPGRREFPWLEGRWTDSQTRKKEWHRRGGLAVDVLRRLPGRG